MGSVKALITSGCSLSEVSGQFLKTWPIILEEKTKFDYIDHRGLGSIGTDFIARRAIHASQQALEKYPGNEILLVCEYSTLWRTAGLFQIDDVFAKKMLVEKEKKLKEDPLNDTWRQQGIDFKYNQMLSEKEPSWFFWNLWRDMDQLSSYYTLYQTQWNMLEQYLWNMYAVQNFCKANNINYVWMQADDEFTRAPNMDALKHWTLKHLHDEVVGTLHHINTPIATWVTEKYPECMSDVIHPTTEGHTHYTDEILIPFLKEQGLIK